MTIVAALVAHAQKKSAAPEDRESERHSLAVGIVRSINTAEAQYKPSHGVFATWDNLISNGDFSESGTKWSPPSLPTVAHAMYSAGPEIVPGWKLRLHLSNDGHVYDLRLEDVNDSKCGYAVISDDTGIVRQSKTIDCPMN
jgi:hypothetical protein